MKLTKIALGVALAAGTVAAQAADVLWFPHVVNSGTVTTVLSVIDAGGTAYATPDPQHMHYVYKAKLASETTAEFNVKECEESDGGYPMSKFDIQTFDLSGVLDTSGAGVLFNDPGVKNNWAGYDYRRAMLTGVEGTRGYFVVEDADAAANSLQGYAMIFDYVSGSAWGYPAETFGAVAHTPTQFTAQLMPPRETITRLMVTPYGTAAQMIPAAPGYKNYLATTLAPVGLDGSKAVANRDEGIESGTTNTTVVCVGTVDVYEDVIAANTKKHVKDGGWMKLTTQLPVAPYDAAPYAALAPAVVYQLDFGGQNATNSQFNGFSYPGTWNNVTVRQ